MAADEPIARMEFEARLEAATEELVRHFTEECADTIGSVLQLEPGDPLLERCRRAATLALRRTLHRIPGEIWPEDNRAG